LILNHFDHGRENLLYKGIEGHAPWYVKQVVMMGKYQFLALTTMVLL